MESFKSLTSHACPLDVPNVDTDQIIPKQFLKRVERTGFGQFLFYDWRFLDSGDENPSFNLNKPEFKEAKILLARDNFGCGSSREHAPWALNDFGYQVIIAPSYADIFYNNCFQNGMLPITLSSQDIEKLFQLTLQDSSTSYHVNLEAQELKVNDLAFKFELDQSRKEKLLKGLDDIGVTLEYDQQIANYEEQKKTDRSFLLT